MSLRPKLIFFTVVSLIILIFLYTQRDILTPFILAAIFACIFNFLVFVFATFFFLKDNEKITNKFLLLVPSEKRVEVTALIKKINNVLSKYLRGQIILVISLALMLFVGFSLLGI